MTEKLKLDDSLTDIAVLTSVKLVQDKHEQPDSLFVYLEGRLSSLVGYGRLAFSMFNPNSYWVRRDPTTNKTVHNVNLPKYNTTPSLAHKMIGTRTHIDASIFPADSSYPMGTQDSKWSGINWSANDNRGAQVCFDVYKDSETRELDKRFDKELIW